MLLRKQNTITSRLEFLDVQTILRTDEGFAIDRFCHGPEYSTVYQCYLKHPCQRDIKCCHLYTSSVSRTTNTYRYQRNGSTDNMPCRWYRLRIKQHYWFKNLLKQVKSHLSEILKKTEGENWGLNIAFM